ncbi:MAG: site-2 protease family protein [Cyanothece sp. SIO2G6]|nr:site-2 protease family protein [Cyanothece sp. SIO2G6]
MVVLWLLLLSIITYISIQKSVSSITRTPVWLLWLVMMMPLLIWILWLVITGGETIPLPLLLGIFLTCPFVYWSLIQLGRRSPDTSDSPSSPSTQSSEASDPPGRDSATHPSLNNMIFSADNSMDRDDEDALKRCFPWSVYYLKGIEHRAQVLICTGHLRASSEVAYRTIRDNIEKQFGQRFLVIFQEGMNGKPFFALVPNMQVAENTDQQRLFRPVVAMVLLLATICTTTLAGMMLAGVPEEDLFPLNRDFVLQGLPYCVALLLVLAAYHFSQYFVARRYQVRSSLPYFIPIPPVVLSFPFGTFGAFLQVRSPMPNRKVLFDMGFVGPIIGILVTLPVLWWGLAHSDPVGISPESSLFSVESFDPKVSFLIAILSKIALPDLTVDTALHLHPVAIAGCLGILVTTINLMPVGQLNGGKIVHAMFGQRTGAFIGQIARLLVLLLAFVHQNQREFWLLPILLFFMPSVDEPALNDVSELDNRRDLLGLAALALLVLIILPAPPVITQLLF